MDGLEPGPATAELVLYFRQGCHLCETLASLLYRGWPEQFERLCWCDVDSRSKWRERYGLRVPVLTEKECVISELVPDVQQLKDYFGAPANPL